MEISEKAKHFVEKETEFHLGVLPTEQSHPKTSNLSHTLQDNTVLGIDMLQSVDLDLASLINKVLSSGEFQYLIDTLVEALQNNKRIFFSGCGATGRLSILLEAAWRRYWAKIKSSHPSIYDTLGHLNNAICSVITGGDRALVQSVENFEDFEQFGRYQIAQENIDTEDVLVAVTEGGETSSVIGTVWEGLERGAKVFFVFNNPADILQEHIKRSGSVIANKAVTKLDLSNGPMAIAGSTRMQAATSELMVTAAALEMALTRFLNSKLSSTELASLKLPNPDTDEYSSKFETLVNDLNSSANLNALAEFTEYEYKIYKEQGLVTYFADEYLLDIFTDTTERAPTFMLPPFRKKDDNDFLPSWVFIKNPACPTKQAWFDIFAREPKGLKWDKKLYKQLNAPEQICDNPPALGNEEIYKFMTGNEEDPSRYSTVANAAITITVADSDENILEKQKKLNRHAKKLTQKFNDVKAVQIGASAADTSQDGVYAIQCDLPASPLKIWPRLAVKLALNTVSTAAMGLMGRIMGNWMACAEATNKKLIDRGTRLVCNLAKLEYQEACEEFLRSLDMIKKYRSHSIEFVPPALFTIYRLKGRDSKLKLPENQELKRIIKKMEDLGII